MQDALRRQVHCIQRHTAFSHHEAAEVRRAKVERSDTPEVDTKGGTDQPCMRTTMRDDQ